MVQFFTLIDAASLGDLKVFLGRAARVEDGSVRLIGGLGVLAAYTAVLTPKGLLDSTPTVLGLRTFALGSPDAFDVVVSIRALLDRLAQLSLVSNSESGPIDVPLPPPATGVAWAGISPPRGGWEPAGTLPSNLLESVARTGIAEVAAAVPADTGEQLVHRVRSEVWGRDLAEEELPELRPRIPAGAAFCAVSLGFVRRDDEDVRVFVAGPWLRLTLRRGHVLVLVRR
ncbi:hypothetical protein [Herbiconiux ginsengi]|uniref:Uncharacterized protein n=1 Tax=Herbiconiux ginsengi TaxID=381665 RepID=A0A1H3RUZ6_9MICO|nr:hypothetical protein [Herbiconiux ginsengi]SDZ29526.1 hypothetical protein SAMN05216554_3104 [Herbiconiux ginsengi]